jgi:deoxyguanosine kinase
MSAPLISVIGPPAAGKTTLAQSLTEALEAKLLREDFEGNPFLSDSYTGNAAAALPAQIYYLLSRVAQLNCAHWPETGVVVSDYGLCQDRIYACEKLSVDELAIYTTLAGRLAEQTVTPSVIIHLDASVETLLARIAARGRGFEQGMDEAFLSRMRLAYNDIEEHCSCPVVRVDTDETDVLSDLARQAILDEIRAILT